MPTSHLIAQLRTTLTQKMILLSCLLLPGTALAEGTLAAADTAWILTATALVLFMTLPGLALFYGGSNILNFQNV